MSLPKIEQQIFELVLPSTGEKIEYRPFLVKEEKLLLTAKESKERNDIIRAIRQIINNCVVTPGFDIDNLTIFDMEYIFIQLRIKSVDNFVQAIIKDEDDDLEYKLDINLEDVKVIKPENHDTKIQINKNLGILLKYPTPKISDSLSFANNIADITYILVKNCIKEVYDEENVYVWDQNSPAEQDAFIDSLNVKAYDAIKDFFSNMPKVYYEAKYTNSANNQKVVKFESLTDFFTWD